MMLTLAYLMFFFCFVFQFKRAAPKPQTEVGTQNDRNNVDYDWLPKETTDFSKLFFK